MNDPRQMYLFNYMEYDDYESNDWEELLFRDDELNIESDTESLLDIVNNECDLDYDKFVTDSFNSLE